MMRALAILCAAFAVLAVAPSVQAANLTSPPGGYITTNPSPLFTWSPNASEVDCSTFRRSTSPSRDALGRLNVNPIEEYGTGNRFQPYYSWERLSAGPWYWQVECYDDWANETQSAFRRLYIAPYWYAATAIVGGDCGILLTIRSRSNIRVVRWSAEIYIGGIYRGVARGAIIEDPIVAGESTVWRYPGSGGCWRDGQRVKLLVRMSGAGKGRTFYAYGWT